MTKNKVMRCSSDEGIGCGDEVLNSDLMEQMAKF